MLDYYNSIIQLRDQLRQNGGSPGAIAQMGRQASFVYAHSLSDGQRLGLSLHSGQTLSYYQRLEVDRRAWLGAAKGARNAVGGVVVGMGLFLVSPVVAVIAGGAGLGAGLVYLADEAGHLLEGVHDDGTTMTDADWAERATSLGVEGGASVASLFTIKGMCPKPSLRAPFELPTGWISKPTEGAGGIEYFDPRIRGNSVRIMPGNPNSQWSNSRNPYVRWLKNGQHLDAHGRKAHHKSPESHIPLDQFRFDPGVYE